MSPIDVKESVLKDEFDFKKLLIKVSYEGRPEDIKEENDEAVKEPSEESDAYMPPRFIFEGTPVAMIGKNADSAFEEAGRKKKQMEEEIKYPEVAEGVLGEAFADEEIKEAFNIFDTNNNGYISAEEIRKMLKAVGEESGDELVDTMIEMFDSAGDGQVSWEDFYCKISQKVNSFIDCRMYLLNALVLPAHSEILN
eukprot:TRINITY_DN9674_c0_g1_i3.p1 TRINITY_DN9674_c0_g1~~TRINITY_DN9674_c0_g1_i3.p1  ORF type:complete len:196 (-),score=72.07 TRINITY_DN9674_c0_g1_i3:114-701(-)